MIGLALSGGGVKGSYQVGAYLAFKRCNIKIDMITGTSIGSLNGAMIASGNFSKLLRFWLKADVGKFLGASKKLAYKINKNIKDEEYYKLSFDNIINIVKNGGIEIKAMQDALGKYNVEDKLRKSKILFGLSTLRLKDLKPLDLFIEDIPLGKLDNYIIASCYIPVFKKEKLDSDSFFFDGGIYNNCPYNMLIEKGCNKVYAIDLGAIGIKQVPKKGAEIIKIKPSRKISGMLSLNKKEIRKNIYLGYFDTLKVLKNYDGHKYIFKKLPNEYYEKLLSNINPKILKKASDFLGTSIYKELVILAVETEMLRKKEKYFKVYNIKKIIRRYQRCKNDSFIGHFINSLQLT
ncbi:MAG: patatin-like phospholipase family protein [Mollicutes bacterium]|nr:patatin-like phospholipase family protein [Mollicutes bacterium]